MANGDLKTLFIKRLILISEMLNDKVGRYVFKMNEIQYHKRGSILVAKLFVWDTKHSYSYILNRVEDYEELSSLHLCSTTPAAIKAVMTKGYEEIPTTED